MHKSLAASAKQIFRGLSCVLKRGYAAQFRDRNGLKNSGPVKE